MAQRVKEEKVSPASFARLFDVGESKPLFVAAITSLLSARN